MNTLLPNEVNHRRHKNGVEIEVTVRTAHPLPTDVFVRQLRNLVIALDLLFDAIPDQPAGGAE